MVYCWTLGILLETFSTFYGVEMYMKYVVLPGMVVEIHNSAVDVHSVSVMYTVPGTELNNIIIIMLYNTLQPWKWVCSFC